MILQASVMALAVAGVTAGPMLEYKEIVGNYRDSVVAVTYTLRPKEKPTGGEGRKVEEAMCGVIADENGLVITSADPFPDPGGDPRMTLIPVEFKVRIRGGEPLAAEAVGLDRDLNLAYLRIKNPPPGLTPPHFVPEPGVDVGDEVVVIGLMSKEYDYEPTFQTGHLSAVLRRPRLMYGLDLYIQDLSIGGLVVSRTGYPIGIVGEDILKEPPSNQNMPANVLSIFGSFAQGRRVGYPMVFPFSLFSSGIASPPPIKAEDSRSWLGIVMQPLNEDLIDYWKLNVKGGIIISSVVEGSPAEGAGLRPADILIELEGEPLQVTKDEDLAGFRRRIERMGVGTEANLAFLRQGKRMDISLPLGEAPKTAWTAEEYEDQDLGVTVREITISDLQGQNLPPTTEGVVVSEMEQAGWCQIAGLQPADIIQSIDRREVTDLESFRTQMDRLHREQPEATILFVLRQTETLFVRVKTPWGSE